MVQSSDKDADEGVPPEWTEPYEVLLVQTWSDPRRPEENLEGAIAMVEAALQEGRADMAVLPEAFATGFPYEDLPSLETFHARQLEAMKKLARVGSLDMIYTQLVRDGGSLLNRCFHLDSTGRVEGHYDKTHLFLRSGEDRHISPGDRLTLFRTRGPTIGPLICYELRFPELSRMLADAGASVLVYPAQWPRHRVFQWEHMLHARAIEDQCFVIGTSTCGDHFGVRMGGRSMVVSPYGDALCSLGGEEGVARARLEPERMKDVRRKIPAYKGPRRDLAFGRVISP